LYSGSDIHTRFLAFDSKGASGHLPGGVATKNPYVAAAKFVMSKREPELEAKKVPQAIAGEIGKFVVCPRNPDAEVGRIQIGASSLCCDDVV
jgi:hypothetical protein